MNEILSNQKDPQQLVTLAQIENQILLIRNQKVMLSNALANLYGVKTKALIQAVKRNIERFPADFMFQLDNEEFNALKKYFPNVPWGKRANPYAFTQEGVAMLSTVLNSKRAIQVNIEIMRVFVRFRQMLASNEDLKRKLLSLEKRYDLQFKAVFDAIRDLMAPPIKHRKQIGFIVSKA
ncbi:MAG TPA: ORF6N domain-containing protein [bacterium]|nr:ORF6N domain-containing protein [bacterium]